MGSRISSRKPWWGMDCCKRFCLSDWGRGSGKPFGASYWAFSFGVSSLALAAMRLIDSRRFPLANTNATNRRLFLTRFDIVPKATPFRSQASLPSRW
jgi:hypothetical protein